MVYELADLLELIHAAASIREVSVAELEKARAGRAAERGGFNERIYLVEVKDD